MDRIRMSSKGQIVIPAKMRKKLSLSKAEDLFIEERDQFLIIKPVVNLSKLKGKFPLKGGLAALKKMRHDWDKEFEERIDEM
ncbi:MAG: AbrB/MazE/SpoVT family DNA-binding domain-containing protein [Candidatus Micrarchaeota archaeon]|nr:AbrB/MazE/SpoVT family DNA-binding domain-containing protein [Candidatus Micrarchaeota archaeon]